MLIRMGLILSMMVALAASAAAAQAVDPFDYPPKFRAPTTDEVRQARASVQDASRALSRGDVETAATQYLLVLELLERTYGQYHPFTLEVSADYGLARSTAGQYEIARPIQELAARGLMDYYGENDPRARKVLDALAATYRDMGETDRAVRIWLWALNKDLEDPEKKPAETLPLLLSLASVLMATERYEEAQPFLAVSEQAYAELGRVDPAFERRIAVLAGNIHALQDRPAEAELAYRRALAVDVGGDDTGLAPLIRLETMLSLAVVLTEMQRSQDALVVYRDMADILTERAGREGRGHAEVRNHPRVFKGRVRSAWRVANGQGG